VNRQNFERKDHKRRFFVIFSLTRVCSLAAALMTMLSASMYAEPAPLPAPPTTAAPPAGAAPAAPATAPAPAAPEAQPAAAAPPAADVQKIGPLELTPLKPNVKTVRIQNSTCLNGLLRMRVKNASESDVKAALLLPQLSATDDLGERLLGRADMLNATGLTTYASDPQGGWAAFLATNSANLTTLGPNQTIDVQITSGNPGDWRTLSCTEDAAQEFMRSYRPSSISWGAQLAVVDLDGNAIVRPFSFSDVPLK
jgi:hypothetical protein